MDVYLQALAAAFNLIISLDVEVYQVVWTSLFISLLATLAAAVISVPLGLLVGLTRFPGKDFLQHSLNTLMALPTVVVGLLLYGMFSRKGPIGDWGLLFTPTAMVIAQTVLVTPIVAALTRQTIEDLHAEYDEQLRSLGVRRVQSIWTLLWDGRYSLLTGLLAGFGRAIAEVGAVIIVGGNINHVTRVMTTTIALETSKGNLELVLALGIILVALAILVNAAVMSLRGASARANW
jgi:tungstate transport system permease protein